MKKVSLSKSKQLKFAVGLIVIALLANIIPAKIALALEIPVYVDNIGTILAAMLGGTLPAVIVGFFSNTIDSFSNWETLYYGIISILIGVAASLFQQYGFFKKISKICIAILTFAILGGVLGSVLTYFLYGYDFGEGISAPFSIAIYNKLGFSKFFSQLTADFALDLIDKTIVLTIAIIIYRKITVRLKTIFSHVFLFDPNMGERTKMATNHLIKRSLLRKVVVMVIVAEILLGALASTTGFFLYRQVTIARNKAIAQGVGASAVAIIDGNRAEEWETMGHAAPGYDDIEKDLYRIRDSFSQVFYLYVYRITNDSSVVLFDLEARDTSGVLPDKPGDRVAFNQGFAPVRENLLRGERVEPIITIDEYGWLLTAYEPLKNSAGKTVAYVGVDISMGDLIYEQAKFFIKLLTMFFGLSVIIMSIVLEFVNRGIVHPVNRMAAASIHFAYSLEQGRVDSLMELESLKIRTFDEIEYLYKALTKTCKDSIDFIRRLEAAADRITRMQDEIIINFAEMVEARDTSTGDHIKKTAFYVEAIADELQKEGKFSEILTDSYKDKLKRSAPLHDIGKIAVSDLILNKPGKLTDEEFAIMKSHTTQGMKILSKIEANANNTMDDNYLKESIEMAHYHHEKWDGSGYPTGIKGEEIPLSARIMAVADVFDALVAERVYKKPFPYEKAMAIITEGAGKHFDPVVVEAFCHISEKLYNERTKLNKSEQPPETQA
ncbi:MAG: HD domain-containing protein [Fibrobacter sp.]|nr:HD domain-containing protein [Fibrobacter sp.]